MLMESLARQSYHSNPNSLFGLICDRTCDVAFAVWVIFFGPSDMSFVVWHEIAIDLVNMNVLRQAIL